MPRTEKDPELIALARTFHGVPSSEQYENMISGMMYSPVEPELLAARRRARVLARRYNTLDPGTETAETIGSVYHGLLTEMLGHVGAGTVIEPPIRPDYGCNTSIGERCFINFNLTILDTSLVVIGDRVQIGPNVGLYSAGHETSVLSRVKNVEWGLPIRIGDDCWIGGHAVILPGVTIGRGCTIGAGAVVTKDVPPYSVVLGAPARVVKTLPTEEQERADPANPWVHLPEA